MPCRVLVTGMGMISGIGLCLPETLASLFSSRSGIGTLRYLETNQPILYPFSEVPLSHQLLTELAEPSHKDGLTRNTLLGMIASREAYRHAGLDIIPRERTGLISATTVGGMDRCELYYRDFLNNDSRNAYIDSYDCADSTEAIAEALNIRDFITTVSTACSSAANAILLGSRMIRSGLLDRVVAGGTEALTSFHINGFSALKILSREPCKPFDANRSGITLGEGAAYVVLESERAASAGDRPAYAEVAGWGNACEAFHQTASSPDGKGAFLAMEKAMKTSNLEPDQIDYVNAHGTGTDNNDLSEGLAIERIFKGKVPPVSSTKPFTGHMTSAAGSAEAILSILSINQGMILPNLNYTTPMPELAFRPVTGLTRGANIRVVLSNSFGFGGNDTTLIFRHINS